MADYDPHPIVVGVAKAFKKSSPGLTLAFDALTAAVAGSQDPADTRRRVAQRFAELPDRPDLLVFAGFLGGQVTKDGNWQLLWLDVRLQSWLLVREEDIVYHERIADPAGPKHGRDYIWVKSTAGIRRGAGSQSKEARFLVGDFTSAGDFAASSKGGTFSAATGLLCEATTPGCCTGINRRTR